jgi:hypothetical protein
MLIRNGLLAAAAVLSFTRLWHSGLPVVVVDRPKNDAAKRNPRPLPVVFRAGH